MVLSPAGGPRRRRARRGRPGGGVPGVLRPRGRVLGPHGLGRRPRRGPRPARSWSARSSAQLYMERQEVPPRILVPDAPGRRATSWRRGSPAPADGRSRSRVPERGREAQADGGRERRTRPRRSTGTSCGARRTSARVPRAGSRAGGSASSSRRCGSSATTSRTWDRPTRSARWWCSRTACPSGATTGGSRSRECPDRTISPAWRRCSAGGSRGCSRSETSRSRRAPPVLPIRRRSSWSDGGRGQLAQRDEGARGRRLSTSRQIGLAKRLEEVYFPDRPDPLMIPRGVRGAVRPAAHPRRGAPVRRHVPPARSGRSGALASPLDDVRRGRTGPEEGVAQAVRLARPAARAQRTDEIAATPRIGPDLAARSRSPTATDGGGAAYRSPSSRMPQAEHTGERGAEQPGPERRRSAPSRPPVHDHHRPLRRRPLGGRTASRTSATSWWTTSRPRCCRRWPSSPSRPADRPASRSWSTPAAACSSASSRRRSRSWSRASGVSDRLPGGVGRRPGEPVRGDARGATRSRPADRVVEGIRKERHDDGGPARRRRPDHRHLRAHAARAPRPHPRGVRRRAARGGASRSRLVSFGFKYGRPARRRPRARRAGSSRTRTGSRSCDRCPGPTTASGRTCGARPTYREFIRTAPRRCSGVMVPGLRRRGEVLPHRRDRLHRRAAPLGGGRRGPRRALSGTRASRSSVDHRDLDRG